MTAQLALAEPADKPCDWCGEAQAVTTWQATRCCAVCAAASPFARVTAWLQRIGRRNAR